MEIIFFFRKQNSNLILTGGRRLFVNMPNMQVWSVNSRLLTTSSWGLVSWVMRMVMVVRNWGCPSCTKLPMNTSGTWVGAKWQILSWLYPVGKNVYREGKGGKGPKITGVLVENLIRKLPILFYFHTNINMRNRKTKDYQSKNLSFSPSYMISYKLA